MPTVSKLTKAKVALVIDQPFFATVLMKLKLIERTDLPTKTMATDGLNIYYDPKFVEDHAVDELKFVLCHEVLHVAYEHMARRGGRHTEKWNHACDYVINDVLSKCEKVGRMPEGGLLNPQLVANGTTSEGVYKLLPEPEEGDDGGGGDDGDGGDGGDIGGRYRGLGEGQPLDDHLDPPDMTEAEKEERARIEAEEAAELARYAAEDARLFDQTGEEWAAWTYSVAGLERDRWTRAHLMINGGPACGRGPSGEARWGHEVDAGTGRCKACERRA